MLAGLLPGEGTVKGSKCFSRERAARIRGLLRQLRRTESGYPQRRIRDELRDACNFYITDWQHLVGAGPDGFTVANFDWLVDHGHIGILDG